MTIAQELDAYARKITTGKLPAGKYHRLACARHLRDRVREAADEPGFPYYFDDAIAERFFRFSAKVRHYKGRRWAGKYVELSDNQRFRLGSLFGWIHRRTGLRRFRTAYNELPRKQGKSLEAAIVVIYGTFFDGEPGAEGYCTATKRDQAKIVFSDAKKLVRSSPELRARVAVHAWNLSQLASSSKLEPLSSDYDSLDGLNPQVIIVDEFHAHKDRGMIGVLETATGSRDQPIMFQITTAGDDELSPCGEQHEYACKILDQAIPADETFFAFIAHADPDDDPFKVSTWKKANPHYGISVVPADLRALAHKAKHMPSALPELKQKRLNMWVGSSSPWLSLERWAVGQHEWSRDELGDAPCYGGLDLASKIDLAAFALVFPATDDWDGYRLALWYFTSRAGLKERARKFRVPLEQWVDEKLIIATPGDRIDYSVIEQTVIDAAATFNIKRIGFDPWNIGGLESRLRTELGGDDERLVEIPQNYKNMSEPSKEFEAEVAAGRMDAGGDLVLRWQISNVVVDQDANGNIRPTKNPRKLRGRIDGLIAAVIGLAVSRLEDEDDDIYSADRGIQTIDFG